MVRKIMKENNNYMIVKILWTIDIIVLCSTIILILLTYTNLPERIAIHFDENGIPNGYAGRSFMFLSIVFMCLIVWVTWSVNLLPDSAYLSSGKITIDQVPQCRATNNVILSICALIEVVVYFGASYYTINYNLNMGIWCVNVWRVYSSFGRRIQRAWHKGSHWVSRIEERIKSWRIISLDRISNKER